MKKNLGDYCEGSAEIVKYLELLEIRLKKSRFNHTLGVVETSAKMARFYGIDSIATMTAAALHDYAKNLSASELLTYATEKGLEIDSVMCASSELLHGAVGAAMVREELGIENLEILNAIAYHTVGRKQMSQMEKIVYLADAIEPGRSEYPGLEDLRELAFENLDAGVLASVTSTLNYVLECGLAIHPNSVDLYNELLNQLGEKPKVCVK